MKTTKEDIIKWDNVEDTLFYLQMIENNKPYNIKYWCMPSHDVIDAKNCTYYNVRMEGEHIEYTNDN